MEGRSLGKGKCSVCVRCKEEKSNELFSSSQLKNLFVNRTCTTCIKNIKESPKLCFSWSQIKKEIVLSRLPREITDLIISSLSVRDHFTFFTVCKYWNNLITSYLYNLKEYGFFSIPDLKIGFLLRALRKLSNITSIYYGYSEISPLKQYHFVELSNMSFLGLQSLDLTSTDINDLNPIQNLCRNLKEFDCSRNGLLHNISPLAHFTKFNQLEYLNLSWNRSIPAIQFEVISQLTSLTNLNIGYTQFGDQQLASLTTLTKLQAILLNGNSYSFSVAGSTLKHFPHLQYLSLDSSHFSSSSSLMIPYLPTSLESISLDFCQWLGDSELGLLASQQLVKLERMSLMDCYFSDLGCEYLSRMTQLKGINMYCYRPTYTGPAVLKMVEKLPNCSIQSEFLEENK